ncbi:hypothetical protein F0344_34025 [Streptomyces finlayi]|uniref:SDR family NAD(P)-dependent oxidoreductase n=1 Tax=Streptomyces finlayi TaxID=67296 RepID=A0A7G7BUC6_9ACTN|nr:hypothetical protein F0344_34025 [Streptomyces finlayi]
MRALQPHVSSQARFFRKDRQGADRPHRETALVTGSTQGIGAAIATGLARAGARVAGKGCTEGLPPPGARSGWTADTWTRSSRDPGRPCGNPRSPGWT